MGPEPNNSGHVSTTPVKENEPSPPEAEVPQEDGKLAGELAKAIEPARDFAAISTLHETIRYGSQTLRDALKSHYSNKHLELRSEILQSRLSNYLDICSSYTQAILLPYRILLTENEINGIPSTEETSDGNDII